MAFSTRFPALQIPVICTADAALIATQQITEYESDFQAVQGIAKTLAPGDPVRLLLLRSAARESQLRSLINFAFQQNFIISAIDGSLDAIGSNYGDRGTRLQPSAALTTLQFTIANIVNIDLTIPQGQIVYTTGAVSNVSFLTLFDATIPAGALSVQVVAECSITGLAGNGFNPGQITQVGSGLTFNVGVTNTTVSSGGADIEADDAYARRLALVPASFSVAGPALAYEFWALTSSPAIMDVSVVGPPTTAAGTVNIYPILQGGVVPTSTVLSQLAAFLNGTAIRPLTDTVNALAPTVVNYNITGTYYVDPQMQTLLPQIQAAVQAALPIFNTYVSSQLGRPINPEHLGQLIMEAGASDYVLTLPTRQILTPSQIGIQSGTMSLLYGGTQPE
jgi:phage-related baseplate assembly protein